MSQDRGGMAIAGHPRPTGWRVPVGGGLVLALDGAVRAAVAVLAGLAITCALALVVWAITPSAGTGPEPLVRAGVATFLLAHFGALDIGGARLTLTPLLLTALFGGTLAVSAGRGRVLGAVVRGEASWIAGGTISYAVLVTLVATVLAPPGSASPSVGIGAALLALLALAGGTLWRGAALRESVLQIWPGRLRTAVHAGTAAAATVVAGGALAFTGALIVTFSTAVTLTGTLTAGWGDGLGLTLVGLGYLPNAVLTAVGYVTGAGFDVGAGRYSPFGNVPADLPPFPLLAAIPTGTGVSAISLISLLVPIAAALVAGQLVIRREERRRNRVFAIVGAAAVAAVIIGVLVVMAGGGVSGGPWQRIGANGWQTAGITFAVIVVVGGTWVVSAGGVRAAVSTDDGSGDGVFDDALGAAESAADGEGESEAEGSGRDIAGDEPDGADPAAEEPEPGESDEPAAEPSDTDPPGPESPSDTEPDTQPDAMPDVELDTGTESGPPDQSNDPPRS